MSSTSGQITPNSVLAGLIGGASTSSGSVTTEDALNALASNVASGQRELGIQFELDQRARNDRALSDPKAYIAEERAALDLIKNELAVEYDSAKIGFINEYGMSNEKAAMHAKKRFDANLSARMIEHRIKYPTNILSAAENKVKGAKLTLN